MPNDKDLRSQQYKYTQMTNIVNEYSHTKSHTLHPNVNIII